jgi:lincosamide nucleotidyltransferase A/C/D/E
VIGPFFERLVRQVAQMVGSPLASVCSLEDVLQITACLEGAGIPFWLVGGWGMDALTGAQLRYHGDLDLVVDDLAGQSGAIAAAFAPLGYEPRGTRPTDAFWLSEGADFGRRGEYVIQVLEVDWELLASVPSLVDGELDPKLVRESLRSACLGSGRLGARALPCLSLPAQFLFHQGHPPASTDRHDPAVLRSLAAEPSVTAAGRETALIIPTFELDATLRQIWARGNPGRAALPPHLNVMSPFLPGEELTGDVLTALEGLFGRVQPFRFELSSARSSEEGALYLAPTSARPFMTMTETVMEAYPALSRYAANFANVTPHLKLSKDVPVADLRRTAARASHRLPVRGEATEVWLVAPGADDWLLLRRFILGGLGK